MSTRYKRIVHAGVLLLALAALSRAVQFRFQQEEQAFRQHCKDQLQKLGITRDAAKARYPTPEIHMVSGGCLTPGATGEVVVKGKFVPDTKILLGNDNLEVLKETLSGNEYRAAVKVAPDIGPQTAEVIAITPVTGITARQLGALAIGGRFEWNLEAANGWKIVARSPANKTCDGRASEIYAVEFFRKGETTPFEKREGKLTYSIYEGVNRFALSQADPAAGGAEDFQALMTKMTDPKLSPSEREQVMKQIEKAQEQMMASMKKASDPAYLKSLEEQKKKFGCERFELRSQSGKLTGEMRCAEAVGARIALTGSVKLLGS
ncbi:MAG TPA: hypothetical protein VKT49_10720 [Bryobacteraceae bacterium]|nr:hypothetical protein [Bryobacteraceae bacterium]